MTSQVAIFDRTLGFINEAIKANPGAPELDEIRTLTYKYRMMILQY